MRKIKYIGFYNTLENNSEKRLSVMSATNKMDYIISKVNDLGYDVDLISPSWTNNNKYYRGKKIQMKRGNTLVLPPTLPWNKIFKVFSVLFSQLWLFYYLLLNIRKGEEVIAYHSLLLMVPLYIAKRIKGFKLILEVEEIYQDVRETSKMVSNMEYKVIKSAEKYIFPTEMLCEKLNKDGKPYTTIYGAYTVGYNKKRNFDDDKIHIVYAGTFDPQKGATVAVEAATYLSSKYHLHIIGFGNEAQKKNIRELISKTDEISECTVTYDGLLKGEEYDAFLQNCDIGLSTQFPNARFNNTSFPSKILSYMASGLRVVSVRIKAIETSAVGDSIHYYEEQAPETIAKTIMTIDMSEYYDGKDIIKRLDTEFLEELNVFLEK